MHHTRFANNVVKTMDSATLSVNQTVTACAGWIVVNKMI